MPRRPSPRAGARAGRGTAGPAARRRGRRRRSPPRRRRTPAGVTRARASAGDGGEHAGLGRGLFRRRRQRLGETRVERLEPRHDLEAQDVARVQRRGVGDVFAVLDARRPAVVADLAGAETEQRPRHLAVARPHADEPTRRGVLGEPVEDGLGLVVAVVRGHQGVVAVLRGKLARAAVPQLAGARLEVPAGDAAAHALHVQRHRGGRAGALDDVAVAVGVGAAQAVVDVQRGQAQAEAQVAVHAGQQGEQRHRVGAAGEQEQGALARAERPGPGGVVHDAALEPEARGGQARHRGLRTRGRDRCAAWPRRGRGWWPPASPGRARARRCRVRRSRCRNS